MKNTKTMKAIVLMMVAALVMTLLPVTAGADDIIDEINRTPQELSISYGSEASAKVGSNFEIDVRFNYAVAINYKPLTAFSFTMSEGAFTLLNGRTSVSSASTDTSYKYTFNVPSGTPVGTHYIQFYVDYTYSNFYQEGVGPSYDPDKLVNVEATLLYKVTVTDTAGQAGAVRIENLHVPDTFIGVGGALSAEIINTGTTDFKDVSAEIVRGGSVVAQKYIGTLGDSPHDLSITVPSFKTAGSREHTLRIRYTEGGTAKTAQQNFTLNVLENSPLTINNFSAPSGSDTGAMQSIAFDLVNMGQEGYSNGQVKLFRGTREVHTEYIGLIESQKKTAVSLEHVFDTAGSFEYRVEVSYENAAGTTLKVERKFNITVGSTSAVSDGSVRIQNIIPPSEVLVKSSAEVDYWLTNPTGSEITGAEAFLLDAGGNELGSMYIPSVEPNSTVLFSIPFVGGADAGSQACTIKVTYRDAGGNRQIISKSFTLNMVTEATSGDGDSERPARLVIQRIDNPPVVYIGAPTPFSYTVVNAGRGAAYNTEVYIVDAQGNEIAREYLGTVASFESAKGEISIRLDVEQEHELTMYATYENPDESLNTVHKGFEQLAAQYRASVADMAGFDWIEVYYPINIEFSVLNNGNLTLLNTNAILTDSNGTNYGELYIGTIEPGTKKERLRFRNIAFNEPGMVDMTITITYENETMREFSFSNVFTAFINEQWVPDYGFEPMPPEGKGDGYYDEYGNWIETGAVDGEGGKVAWWVWLLIFGGVGVVIITVLVIVFRKRSLSKESAEMERFIKLMASGGGAIAEPAAYPAAYPEQSNVDNEE